MPKAIRIYEQGGPEVLKWEDVELPPPGQGEVRLRHDAVGLNYIDTYHRGGVYKMPLPTGIGKATQLMSGWGLKFFDYDNDGNLDLFLANGNPDDLIGVIERPAPRDGAPNGS